MPDCGLLARIVEGGRIENVYRLQLMNAFEARQNFHFSVEALPSLAVAPKQEVSMELFVLGWKLY